MKTFRPIAILSVVATMPLAACGTASSADGLTPQEQERLDAAAQRLDDQRAGLPDRSAQKDAPVAE